MRPSEKAKAERSQHEIKELEPGRYRVDPFGRGGAWNEKVLIIKAWDEKHYVYLLPTKGGKVALPDRWWGWGRYHCSDFRPEVDVKGFIRKGGVIRCHDEETSDWGASLWQWAYDGKPKEEWGVEMYAPPYEVANGVVYINR